MISWRFTIGGMVLLLVLLAAVSCVPPLGWPGRPSFQSNGERIYFTATSASGEPIRYRGGPFEGMMRHPLACVNCHGPQGKGGVVNMMMWRFTAPDIRWHTLTEAEGHTGTNEHEEHPPYNEEALKRVIVEGVGPAGEPLGRFMPRWSMSERDLDDLVAFLKTL